MLEERLHKVLAHAGFGSRRACEKRIAMGEVSIDGKIVTEMGVKVDPSRQRIKCGGRVVQPPRLVTVMLNKPRRVVTTAKDERGRRTVLDCLQGRIRERVYPAGRLDSDSQGMIILTNDGDLCHKLTHPSFRIPRTYHVVIEGVLTEEVQKKIERGVWLAEGKTGPIEVHVKKRDHQTTVAEVIVREGMNREVRRIFARYGLEVHRLRRIKIGKLELGTLGEGQFRPLNGKDMALLLSGGGDEKRPRPQAKPVKKRAGDEEKKPEPSAGEEE